MSDGSTTDEGKEGSASDGEGREDDLQGSGRATGRSGAEVNGGSQEAAQPQIFGVDELDELQRIELIESAHDLPGIYPVVVIAARDEVFRAILLATVEFEQDGDPFTITDRESSHGNYISYRVEMHVVNGRAALDRKAVLAALTGVVTIL